jgi:hypothetical protein
MEIRRGTFVTEECLEELWVDEDRAGHEDPAILAERHEEELLDECGCNFVGVRCTEPYHFYQPKNGDSMKHVFAFLDTASPVTTALVARTWANVATCGLISMVKNKIIREQRLAKAGGIDAFNTLLDEAKDEEDAGSVVGVEPKMTLSQLTEFTCAIRGYAMTCASGLDGPERKFAQPQPIESSVEFLGTPRTAVNQDQIDAVLEEEPELSKEAAIKIIQQMAINDAAEFRDNQSLICDHINALITHAESDREMDTIVDELPESYRDRMVYRAIETVQKELVRSLPWAIKGVPGVSAKRKVLRADLPGLEALAA